MAQIQLAALLFAMRDQAAGQCAHEYDTGRQEAYELLAKELPAISVELDTLLASVGDVEIINAAAQCVLAPTAYKKYCIQQKAAAKHHDAATDAARFALHQALNKQERPEQPVPAATLEALDKALIARLKLLRSEDARSDVMDAYNARIARLKYPPLKPKEKTARTAAIMQARATCEEDVKTAAHEYSTTLKQALRDNM